MKQTTANYNWQGWELDNNKHGNEFDMPARKRMVEGGQELGPFISKYASPKKALRMLEIGPFFNPLVIAERYPLSEIVYWEGDEHAFKWLNCPEKLKKDSEQRTFPVFCNLNDCHLPDFLDQTKSVLKVKASSELTFDSIVVSQVFNYIDYKQLMGLLSRIIAINGYLFINNVSNYGLPSHFSPNSPKSNNEIIATALLLGFTIIEKTVIPVMAGEQKHDRLLLTLKKTM